MNPRYTSYNHTNTSGFTLKTKKKNSCEYVQEISKYALKTIKHDTMHNI